MGLLRIIFRLVCFWRASERRTELQRDLRATHEAHRSKADFSSQDYRLKRDLAALNDENEN